MTRLTSQYPHGQALAADNRRASAADQGQFRRVDNLWRQRLERNLIILIIIYDSFNNIILTFEDRSSIDHAIGLLMKEKVSLIKPWALALLLDCVFLYFEVFWLVDSKDYSRLAWVDLEIDFFQFVPIIDNALLHWLSFKAAIEELSDEVIIWFFVEFDWAGIVHQVYDFQRHLVTQHFWCYSFLELFGIDLGFSAFCLNNSFFTSLCLIQGNFPILR